MEADAFRQNSERFSYYFTDLTCSGKIESHIDLSGVTFVLKSGTVIDNLSATYSHPCLPSPSIKIPNIIIIVKAITRMFIIDSLAVYGASS